MKFANISSSLILFVSSTNATSINNQFDEQVARSYLRTESTLAEFTALTGNISQTATGVSVPATCNRGDSRKYPNVMYTVETSSDGGVTISTDPANLMTVVEKDGTLSFEFNDTVADEAKDGAGVLIQMPPDQLQFISCETSGILQVKSGFTSVQSVRAETSGKLDADLGTANTTTLSISAETSGVATVQVGSGGGGDVSVQTSGVANIQGDVATVRAQTSGKAVVSGIITNPSGSSISTSGTIHTTDCTGIEPDITGGRCRANSPSVSVNVAPSCPSPLPQ